MALIQCPECNKEISDKVNACPHCGYPLANEPEAMPTPESQAVEKVIEQAPDKAIKNRPKNIKVISACAAAAILIIVVSVFVSKNAAQNTYIENLSSVRMTMLSGGADAEELVNLTCSVWYNTIYKKSDAETNKYTKGNYGFNSDFNVSLRALSADTETQTKVDALEANKAEVDAMMKKLQKPSDDLKACYETVNSMYQAYRGLVNLAVSPSGNLKSYTAEFRTYDTDFMKYYDQLETQIPEK